MGLSKDEVLAQSKAAFAQWGETWTKHAVENGKKYKADGHSHKDLAGVGVGRKLLICAFAASLEYNIETIKKYNDIDGLDIMCVDKVFGYLVSHGVKPTYVMLADAGISPDWFMPWIDDTEGVILLANITASLEWTLKWKGPVIYYTNKDNIKTEEIYSKLSGCKEVIPAASNVGNAAVVMPTQMMAYDKYMLVGYDFSWGPEDNYYADKDSDKRWWMHHLNIVDMNGDICYTSNNLYFSCRWLFDYYNKILRPQGIKLVNCSNKGIFFIERSSLEYELSSAKERKISEHERDMILKARMRTEVIRGPEGKQLFQDIVNKNPVESITVNYNRPSDLQFIQERMA